jgi:AcrR family transcriptional regulator
MEAAARIFAEQGYNQTTTRAIADAADMAEGTLYNYFANKREILLAIAEQTRAEFEQILGEAGAIEHQGDMVALVERGLNLIISRLAFTRTLWLEAWTDDDILREYATTRLKGLHQRIEAFILDRVEAGAFRALDTDLTARMALGLFFAPILPVMRGVAPPPDSDSIRLWAQTAVDLMLRGVQATP